MGSAYLESSVRHHGREILRARQWKCHPGRAQLVSTCCYLNMLGSLQLVLSQKLSFSEWARLKYCLWEHTLYRGVWVTWVHVFAHGCICTCVHTWRGWRSTSDTTFGEPIALCVEIVSLLSLEHELAMMPSPWAPRIYHVLGLQVCVAWVSSLKVNSDVQQASYWLS